jgi:hypothetical protein
MVHKKTIHSTMYLVSDFKATFPVEAKPRISSLPWKHLVQKTHHDSMTVAAEPERSKPAAGHDP